MAKEKFCISCGKKLRKNIIALNYKLSDEESYECKLKDEFRCLKCMAELLGTDVNFLKELIELYIEQGCVYFE